MEARSFEKDCPDGISLNLVNPEDPFTFEGTIMGPEDTPLEGGIFFLRIECPRDYPQKPPKVKFTTKTYHPNITEDGEICIPILKEEWTPAVRLWQVMTAIRELLVEPGTESPLRGDVAELYTRDRSKYDETVREYVNKYAS